MNNFTLHPKLQADTMLVCDLPLSRILLMNNANFPWLIMVPRIADVTEIFNLSPENQITFSGEINLVAQLLKSFTNADKINIAMLGNQVPQLHCHVIARFKTDTAWPNPVWGLPSKAYGNNDAEPLIAALQKLLT